MNTYQEYTLIMSGLITLGVLLYMKYRQQRSEEARNEEWSDLNNMFTDLYQANDMLKKDLHHSASKLKVMAAVQDTLKLTSETMYQVNSEIMDALNKTVRACDGLSQEVAALKGEIPENPPLTGDDLDDWHETIVENMTVSNPNQINLFDDPEDNPS